MQIKNKLIKSSFLLILIKVFQRSVGLVSFLILTRILVPEDFAILALTSITIYFFDVLASAGSEQYIIKKETITDEDLNTAWTIDIIMKSMVYAALIIASPFIADYFNQPELLLALIVSASILIINALKNPGIFLLKQRLDYTSLFWLSVIQKSLTFIIVILVAFYYRSFWALIIGDIISSLVYTVGTYTIHRYRPGLSLKHYHLQWRFSKWLVFKSVIGYLRSQIDTLMVSKLFSGSITGTYYVCRNIAMLPSHSILAPAIEPLLAAFNKNETDTSYLQAQLAKTLLIVSIITIPICVFMFSFSQQISLTLLGDRWEGTEDMLKVMSLFLLYFSFIQVLVQVLMVLGKTKILFFFDLFSLSFIVFSLAYLALSFNNTWTDIYNIALTRGLCGLITLMVLFLYLWRTLKFHIISLHGLLSLIGFSMINFISAALTNAIPQYFEFSFLQLMQQGIFFLVITTVFTLLFTPFFKKELKIIKNIFSKVL